MNEKEIEEFMEEHADLFRDLGEIIRCPKCHRIVRGEKFNLGEKYYWFEGCEKCSLEEVENK